MWRSVRRHVQRWQLARLSRRADRLAWLIRERNRRGHLRSSQPLARELQDVDDRIRSLRRDLGMLPRPTAASMGVRLRSI